MNVSYSNFNQLQRLEAKCCIDKFAQCFKLDSDGNVTLLDIGCGPGDVLFDIVAPKLPENKRKIVGIDVSQKMINCAREKYSDESFMEFKKLDFSSDFEECQKTLKQSFDNITSFCCFHWLPDHK